MMPMGLWMVVAWMAFVCLTGMLFLWWGATSGQFKDIEQPKYTMLDDKDPEPWPHGQGGDS
jgi:cbb3-type cytochrome oxidase maturation protein